MITQERFDRVCRMLEDRAQYYHKKMMESNPHDLVSSSVMTAYNSALIILIEAEKGYDDLLDQFDYYHEKK